MKNNPMNKSSEGKGIKETKTEIFKWGYRLLLALAIRNLHDAQNTKGNWPKQMEWGDLVGSSQAIFLEKARNEAGVDDWYLEYIWSGTLDKEATEIFNYFENQHQK